MKLGKELRRDFARLFNGAAARLKDMSQSDVAVLIERGLGEVLKGTQKRVTVLTKGTPVEEARRQWLKRTSDLAYRRASEIKRCTGNDYDVIVKRAIEMGLGKNGKTGSKHN